MGRLLQRVLSENGLLVEVFDGDDVRTRFSKGLGFSKQDRDENVRRISREASLVTELGGAAIVSVVSPYGTARGEARRAIGNFIEVYVQCPLEECIRRDVKGLYKKALAGEISNFTGISDPYDEPLDPEVLVETDRESPEESLAKILTTIDESVMNWDLRQNNASSAGSP